MYFVLIVHEEITQKKSSKKLEKYSLRLGSHNIHEFMEKKRRRRIGNGK